MSNQLPNNFIDDLVKDLKPSPQLKSRNLWIAAALIIAIFSGLIIAIMGMRADFSDAVKNGVIAWKNGGLLILALAAMLDVLARSRPDNKKSKISLVLIILFEIIIISQLVILLFSGNFLYELTHINLLAYQSCMSVILLGGVLIFALIWRFWLVKTASQYPQHLGMMAGVFSGAIAAFSYALHCNMDGIFYYIICYMLPLFNLGVLGYILGSRLKW